MKSTSCAKFYPCGGGLVCIALQVRLKENMGAVGDDGIGKSCVAIWWSFVECIFT